MLVSKANGIVTDDKSTLKYAPIQKTFLNVEVKSTLQSTHEKQHYHPISNKASDLSDNWRRKDAIKVVEPVVEETKKPIKIVLTKKVPAKLSSKQEDTLLDITAPQKEKVNSKASKANTKKSSKKQLELIEPKELNEPVTEEDKVAQPFNAAPKVHQESSHRKASTEDPHNTEEMNHFYSTPTGFPNDQQFQTFQCPPMMYPPYPYYQAFTNSYFPNPMQPNPINTPYKDDDTLNNDVNMQPIPSFNPMHNMFHPQPYYPPMPYQMNDQGMPMFVPFPPMQFPHPPFDTDPTSPHAFQGALPLQQLRQESDPLSSSTLQENPSITQIGFGESSFVNYFPYYQPPPPMQHDFSHITPSDVQIKPIGHEYHQHQNEIQQSSEHVVITPIVVDVKVGKAEKVVKKSSIVVTKTYKN